MIKTTVLIALLGLATVYSTRSQDRENTVTSNGSVERELVQAEKDWAGALRKQDIAAVRKFMAEDYVLVGVRTTGSNTVDLDTWLKGLANMQIHSYEAEVKRVRIYGDSAVLSVEGSWHIGFQGREIDENFFLTDVWIKKPDGWKIVLRHSSPYPRQSR
jgi:ketosteroid isomerase-like protein